MLTLIPEHQVQAESLLEQIGNTPNSLGSLDEFNTSTESAESTAREPVGDFQVPCFTFDINNLKGTSLLNDEGGVWDSASSSNCKSYNNSNNNDNNNNNQNKGNKTSAARDACSDTHSRTNLFISNIPHKMDQSDLEKMFAPFGEILSAAVMRNIHTGNSLGNAFVRYATTEEAKKAIAGMAGKRLNGRTITVQWAKKQHDDTPVGEARKKIFKLFVRNIPLEIGVNDLTEMFCRYGPVKTVSIHKDTAPDTEGHLERHIAFITYLVEGAAEKAAEAVHNTRPFQSCGKIPLMVKLAEDFPQHSHHNNGANGVNSMKGNKPMQRVTGKVTSTREGPYDSLTTSGALPFGNGTATNAMVGGPSPFFPPMAGAGSFMWPSAIPGVGVRSDHVYPLGAPIILPQRAGIPVAFPDGSVSTNTPESLGLNGTLVAPYYQSSVPVISNRGYTPVQMYTTQFVPLTTSFGGSHVDGIGGPHVVDISGFASPVPMGGYASGVQNCAAIMTAPPPTGVVTSAEISRGARDSMPVANDGGTETFFVNPHHPPSPVPLTNVGPRGSQNNGVGALCHSRAPVEKQYDVNYAVLDGNGPFWPSGGVTDF